MNKNEEAMITKLKRSTTEVLLFEPLPARYVWIPVNSRNEKTK